MAKFKYLGPGGLVGRFGRLKTGDIVDMWQSETDYVLSHGCDGWEQVLEPADMAGVGVVLPQRTPFYDLTRICWTKDMVPALRRMSRPELLSVCRAMHILGAKLPGESVFSTYTREALFELAYGEAKRLKWDYPGIIKAEAPAPQPEPEEEDSQQEQETVTAEPPADDEPAADEQPEPEAKPVKVLSRKRRK